ncbi:MAG: hypothetical protein QNI84_10820 [Henriciella sp.]|nr:hypothetical protein [Henriciella sp.]
MIRTVLVGMVFGVFAMGSANAQTFRHTHGKNAHSHSHDISPVVTSGDCCCGSRIEYIPVEHHAKRTVTRTRVYTHPTVTRHVYTRTLPATIIRSSHHGHHNHTSHHHHAHGYHSHHNHHDTERVVVKHKHKVHKNKGYVEQEEARVAITHTDRAEPYAHYDRHWKRRK